AAGTCQDVMKSTDGGGTWTEHMGDLDTDGLVNRVVIDPFDPRLLWIGLAQQDGIYYSPDAGESWVLYNEGLYVKHVCDLHIQKAGTRRFLYAATSAGICLLVQDTAPATPTPVPTPVRECPFEGVAIDMPGRHFTPGSTCFLNVSICANMVPDNGLPLICALEFAGVYWFYPRWSEAFDYYLLYPDPGRLRMKTLIEPFMWPPGCGAGSGLRFIAAVTDPDFISVIGAYDLWEFSYSE
ncbi:hypothetical protein JW905_18565, partial [bacterium]|nr:hypothetical protein [candidate division CSSED10-310 bacterium]